MNYAPRSDNTIAIITIRCFWKYSTTLYSTGLAWEKRKDFGRTFIAEAAIGRVIIASINKRNSHEFMNVLSNQSTQKLISDEDNLAAKDLQHELEKSAALH